MSIITSDFFRDIFVYKVYPRFRAPTIAILRRVSKDLLKFVDEQASMTHTDRTLSNRTVSKDFKGKVPSYLRYIIKDDTLRGPPSLWQTLDIPGKSIPNPDDLKSWIDYTNTTPDTHLPTAAVLFDFDKPLLKAQGNCSLGDALNREIWEYPPNLPLIKVILAFHPNSDQINANGMYGLGRALCSAIVRANSIEIVKEILKHKNAKSIPATGTFSLASAILNAIDAKNGTEMVSEILKHPDAKLIPQGGHYGYLNCMKKAEREKANEIHEKIMNTFCAIQPASSKTPQDN